MNYVSFKDLYNRRSINCFAKKKLSYDLKTDILRRKATYLASWWLRFPVINSVWSIVTFLKGFLRTLSSVPTESNWTLSFSIWEHRLINTEIALKRFASSSPFWNSKNWKKSIFITFKFCFKEAYIFKVAIEHISAVQPLHSEIYDIFMLYLQH